MPPAVPRRAQGSRMTDSNLTEHRLRMLEEISEGFRRTERDVDLLKVSMTRFEALLVEVRTEGASRSDTLHASLARLHQRFDDLAAEEHREQGAKAERKRLSGKFVLAVGVGTAVGGVLVGVANFFI